MIDTLRSAAHLQREIGDDLFAVLVSSDNTDAVREFAMSLARRAFPTTLILGGRAYDILGFLRGDKDAVKGGVMVTRAKKMGADLGQEDGEYLLANQGDIPVALRGKVAFVFTNWRRPGRSRGVAYVDWDGDRWVQDWHWLGHDWHGRCRVLRRK